MLKKSLTSRKGKSEPLIFDIFLHHDSSPSSNAQLTIDFIKFLCHQKGQIPLPFPQLVRRLDKVKTEHVPLDKDDLTGLKMKERMSALKNRRNELNFLKKGDAVTDCMNNICESVVSSFDSDKNLQQIAAVIGTSIFNPKEIFVLDWSQWNKTDSAQRGNAKTIKQNQSTFFRFLVTADQLFPAMQSVNPSRLHVLCQTNCGEPIGCLPRSNYQFPPRGRKIILRILPKTPITPGLCFNPSPGGEVMKKIMNGKSDQTVSRRLEFPSPLLGARKMWKCDEFNLDISGVVQLEEDQEDLEDQIETACWFQVQCFILGFRLSL